MEKEKMKIKVSFNSPVVLTFAIICVCALFLNFVTGGITNRDIFSVYRPYSYGDPLVYVRFICHVFGHQDFSHLFGNMTLILLVGPLLEEKYGHGGIMSIILLTAIVTGVLNVILFSNVALLGASGVVFAFIILSSITSFKNGTIPLTFILITIIYIGQEIYSAMFIQDNISNLTHIVGGGVGAFSGYVLNVKKNDKLKKEKSNKKIK